jgi:hypothetical protein
MSPFQDQFDQTEGQHSLASPFGHIQLWRQGMTWERDKLCMFNAISYLKKIQTQNDTFSKPAFESEVRVKKL